MDLPEVVTKQNQVSKAVSEVAAFLHPDVEYIRYDVGQDWSGDWAIFFRAVISDEAASRRLRDVSSRVVWMLGERLDFGSMGVIPYYNFRSKSEQSVLQETAWKPIGQHTQGWL